MKKEGPWQTYKNQKKKKDGALSLIKSQEPHPQQEKGVSKQFKESGARFNDNKEKFKNIK